MRIFWLVVLILFCLAVFVMAMDRALSYGGTGAYALATVAFATLVAVFCVGVLDYKVGGSSIALERRVDKVAKKNEELTRAVQHLTRALLVVKDAACRYDGALPPHEQLLREHLAGLSEHLPERFVQDAESVIAARVEAHPP